MIYKNIKCYYRNGMPAWCGNWPQDLPIPNDAEETTCMLSLVRTAGYITALITQTSDVRPIRLSRIKWTRYTKHSPI